MGLLSMQKKTQLNKKNRYYAEWSMLPVKEREIPSWSLKIVSNTIRFLLKLMKGRRLTYALNSKAKHFPIGVNIEHWIPLSA